MSYLPSNLKYLRGQKQITQQELADTIYKSRDQIASWECGRFEPDIKSVTQLSSFFRVSVSSLVTTNIQETDKVKHTVYYYILHQGL